MSQEETQSEINLEDLKTKASLLPEQLIAFRNNPQWSFSKEITTDKKCSVFNLESGAEGERLASKGVVEDVEGTPSEVYNLLHHPGTLEKLHPNASEIKIFKEITPTCYLSYCRFPGMGPVADRDMVLLHQWTISQDDSRYIHASASVDYPYPSPQGTVRAEAILSGFIVEKTSEETSRVTYISDADLKGMIPGFVKRLVTEDEGKQAGKINELLIDWKTQASQQG